MSREVVQINVFGEKGNVSKVFYERRKSVPAPGDKFWVGSFRYEVVYRVQSLVENWTRYDLTPPRVWVERDPYERPDRKNKKEQGESF